MGNSVSIQDRHKEKDTTTSIPLQEHAACETLKQPDNTESAEADTVVPNINTGTLKQPDSAETEKAETVVPNTNTGTLKQPDSAETEKAETVVPNTNTGTQKQPDSAETEKAETVVPNTNTGTLKQPDSAETEKAETVVPNTSTGTLKQPDSAETEKAETVVPNTNTGTQKQPDSAETEKAETVVPNTNTGTLKQPDSAETEKAETIVPNTSTGTLKQPDSAETEKAETVVLNTNTGTQKQPDSAETEKADTVVPNTNTGTLTQPDSAETEKADTVVPNTNTGTLTQPDSAETEKADTVVPNNNNDTVTEDENGDHVTENSMNTSKTKKLTTPKPQAKPRQPAKNGTGLPNKPRTYPKNTKNENLKFYRGEISSRTWFGGKKIDEMLKWKGNYTELERNHSYIQWLFPIPEGSGMNPNAQALQEHEAEAIMLDNALSDKVLKAYSMMLDFYGWKLVCPITGQIDRSTRWPERYKHLNKSVHNRLRISRIVKSLGHLGFKHLQVPLVKFILIEAIHTKELPALDGGSLQHWIGAVSEDRGKEYLWKYYCGLKGYDSSVPREPVSEPEEEDWSVIGSSVDGAPVAGGGSDQALNLV